MKISVVVATLGLAALSGPVASQDVLPRTLHAELDTLFADARLDLRAPGLIYGFVAEGRLVHTRAFGVRDLDSGAPVTADTAFRIASMTKMMTALLVHDLDDLGKLSLGDPAENYVPAMKVWKYPTKDSRKASVRDLVNHTAGFVTDDPWADRELGVSAAELDAYLRDAQPFSHVPGTRWEYSNLGYVILGRIIENVTGQSYGERLRERILDPLGMDDTRLDGTKIDDEFKARAYNWTDEVFVEEPFLASGAFDPLGGIWTTANDYGVFVSWMLSAWPPRDAPDSGPIPRHVVRSVTDSQRVRSPFTRPGATGKEDCTMAGAYGMGLSVTAHCTAGLLLSHGGGFPGYGTYVLMSPEQGWGIFVFANHTYAGPSSVAWEAAAKLIASGHFRNDTYPLQPDAELIRAYKAIKNIYRELDIAGSDLRFANNFFRDRSKERWNRQLASIRQTAGACDTRAELKHDGRLSGAFTWTCETARVAGRLVLSPVRPAAVQYLQLRTIELDEDGREIILDHDFH